MPWLLWRVLTRKVLETVVHASGHPTIPASLFIASTPHQGCSHDVTYNHPYLSAPWFSSCTLCTFSHFLSHFYLLPTSSYTQLISIGVAAWPQLHFSYFLRTLSPRVLSLPMLLTTISMLPTPKLVTLVKSFFFWEENNCIQLFPCHLRSISDLTRSFWIVYPP